MNKQQREDLDRTNELLINIWSKVIKNKYLNLPDSDVINQDDIESNQGRIQKAIRLLGNNIEYAGEAKRNRYNGDTRTVQRYRVLNLDNSRQFATKPAFKDTLQLIHNELFPIAYSSQESMDTICYQNLYEIRPDCIIYVYWNEKEFDFVKVVGELRIYPIASLDTRMKLKEGAIKKEDHFNPKIRNFAAHGHRFDIQKYYGKNGFLEEYTHFRDYFQALMDQMKMFQYYVDNAGGQITLTEKYRKDIITTLPKKAPLYAFTQAIEFNRLTPVKDQFKNPYLNAFILKNAQYLNYNFLYSDNTDLLYIDLNDRSTRDTTDTPFTPDQGELDLIAGKA
jgi:hypothetical protein